MNDIRKILACPLCGSALERKGGSLYCMGERRHCFDIASSGYVNLLPPGREKNSRTGDDGEMIAARKRFLASGHYDAISVRIGELISSLAKKNGKESLCLIDSGCGEGRHTCNIIKTLAENGISTLAIGFDASKKGASSASKFMKSCGFSNAFDEEKTDGASAFFAAGNIFTLPVVGHGADVVVSMFAPIAAEENRRVLKDDGYLVVAASGAEHLKELRALLYDEVRLSSGEVRTPDGFIKVHEEIFRYKTTVESNSLLKDLFTMTPFYYRTSESDKAKLDSVESLEITAEVVLCVFAPRGE